MPQHPLLVARHFEQQLVLLANGADHFDCEAKVRAEKYNTLNRLPYLALIRLVKEHCDAVMNHAAGLTVLEALLPYCPAAVNPLKIALRRGIEEATAQLNRASSQQAPETPRRRPTQRANQRRAPTSPAG